LRDDGLHHPEKGGGLLFGAHGEEDVAQVLGDGDVGVESDERGLRETGPGELDQRAGQRGREEQRLSAFAQPAHNLLELLRETHLEQSAITKAKKPLKLYIQQLN
jgi:hypothetical protein